MEIECKICGKIFRNLKSLEQHLSHRVTKKSHNINGTKDYYNKFFKKEGEDICFLKGCNKETSFISLKEGYRKYCCLKHRDLCIENRKKISENNKKSWKDPKSGHNSENRKEKQSISMKKAWSDMDSFLRSEDRKEKQSKKMKEIWADPNGVFNTQEHRELRSELMKELWKDPNCIWRSEEWLNEVVPKRSKNIKQKMKKIYEENGEEIYKKAETTWKENLGDHPMRVEKTIEKFEQTCLKNYGGHPMKNDEIKEKLKNTCLNRYGVDYFSKTKECKEKVKQTNIKKYGVSCSLQNEEVKEKSKQTSIKHYGVDHYTKTKTFRENQKQKMLNGGAAHARSFIKRISKPQEKLFNLTKELYSEAKLEYPCLNYSIDIIIPTLKIAIEYDGSYWHQDQEADDKRQKNIENEGWIFLRYRDYIPSKEELEKDIKILL